MGKAERGDSGTCAGWPPNTWLAGFICVVPDVGRGEFSLRPALALVKQMAPGAALKSRSALRRCQDPRSFLRDTALMQYRSPVGEGPSGNTWPK